MTISYVSSDENPRNDAGPISSVSKTIDIGARTNGLLVVLLIARSSTAGDVTSVTWNGVNLSQAVETSDTPPFADIWYLANPANGSNSLVVNFAGSGSYQGGIVAAWFDGADQSAPLDQTNTASGTSTAPSVNITPSEDNELCVAILASESNDVPTIGGGETEIHSQDQGAFGYAASYVIQTTAGAQAMDFATLNDPYVLAAATFKQAGGGPAAPTPKQLAALGVG